MRRLFLNAAVTVGMAITASSTAPTPSAATAFPTDDSSTRSGSSPAESRDDKSIVHALNRLGFGPRPGDLEKVREMGLQRYIDQQFHPEKIDDSSVDSRFA